MTSHVPVRPSGRVLARGLVVASLALGLAAPALPATAVELDAVAPVAARSTADLPQRERLTERASRTGARSRLAAPPRVAPQAAPAPQVLVTERLPIPFRSVRREAPSRYQGTEVVVAAGREGVLERTYADLGPAGRRLVEEERVREPVTRVVEVGTKPRPRARPAYGGLDWAALAQCESGGNPRAVSRTGRYRGLYQFSLSTWRSVGGTGDPIDHSRDSQTAHAYRLYQRDGRAPWPHCGRHL